MDRNIHQIRNMSITYNQLTVNKCLSHSARGQISKSDVPCARIGSGGPREMTNAVARIIEELRSRGGLKATDIANIASKRFGGLASLSPPHVVGLCNILRRHPEALAASRRASKGCHGRGACDHPSRRRARCAAPQDDGFVFCRRDFAIAPPFPNPRKML